MLYSETHIRKGAPDAFLATNTQRSRPVTFADDVRDTFDALASRKGLICATTLLGILFAIAYIWTTPPLYRSSTEILIDPRTQEIVDREIIPSGLGSSSLGADTYLLDSQVEVLSSQSVLRQVIDRNDLINDGEFVAGDDNMIVEGIKDLLKLVIRGPQASRVEKSPYDLALTKLRSRMSVNRKGNTYVLAIDVDTQVPEKSAAIANSVSDIYTEETVGASRRKILEAEGILTSRLEELRNTVQVAQEKVEAFRAENGLLSTESVLVAEQQLRDLNEQLTLARASTNRARARQTQVQSLKNNPVAAASALADLVSSQLLSDLRRQLAQISAREASLKVQFLDQHPTVVAATNEKQAVERVIATEVTRLLSQFQSDLEIAESNEREIERQMSELEQTAASSNLASITLRELEREAQANQTLYTSFLTRAKDAREQADLPTDRIRTISRAFAATQPIWPLEVIIMPLGAIIGLMAGVGLALLINLLKGTRHPRYEVG